MRMTYQEQALAGATGMELVLALYSGLVRFLYQATACIEEGDVRGRRLSVKRALDILMYLQAKLPSPPRFLLTCLSGSMSAPSKS